MKKKLFVVLLMIISFGVGVLMTAFVLTVVDGGKLTLCRKKLLTPQEKQEVLSKFEPTKNPFFSIPNLYEKEDLLKTKNFYIQNEFDEDDESSCLSSNDIYSWKNNAYLEFEDGSMYEVKCAK